MAGPVKGNDSIILIFCGQVFSKMLGSCCILAAAEAVSDKDDMAKRMGRPLAVMAEKKAADAVSLTIDIEFFLHDALLSDNEGKVYCECSVPFC